VSDGPAPIDLLGGRDLPELDPDTLRRYSRHLVLPEVGLEGQRRLAAARVLVVGAGGLGSPVALYLAAAGVGTLGLVDFDVVDESNLQRQVLYGVSDVGRPKIEAAVERLADLNPHIRLVPHPVRLTSENALDVVGGYDVVVDGSDNFPTRYLVNDACVLLGKPYVYGSIFRFEGQVSVFWGAHGPCYRCLFAEPPPPGLVPSCAEGGVLGVLPGVIGSLQANEAIKLLLPPGSGAEPFGAQLGRLITFDALRLRFRELRLKKNPDCPVCSASPTQTELIDYEAFCAGPEASAPAADEPAPAPEDGAGLDGELPFSIGPQELAAWLEEGRPLRLLDVRTPMEHQIARIEGAALIPLQELARREAEVAAIGRPDQSGQPLVVYCHHGSRSHQATAYLRECGHPAINLDGGIEAWSLEVDPSVPRY
jgi:sulfur-carrier protein adenylyltransferase/sulfurtransferase